MGHAVFVVIPVGLNVCVWHCLSPFFHPEFSWSSLSPLHHLMCVVEKRVRLVCVCVCVCVSVCLHFSAWSLPKSHLYAHKVMTVGRETISVRVCVCVCVLTCVFTSRWSVHACMRDRCPLSDDLEFCDVVAPERLFYSPPWHYSFSSVSCYYTVEGCVLFDKPHYLPFCTTTTTTTASSLRPLSSCSCVVSPAGRCEREVITLCGWEM